MANKTPAIRTVTVRAPVNIAVIKYWGKSDEKLIIPLNDSISGTLDMEQMCATTSVALSAQFTSNRMWLNGEEVDMTANARLLRCIEEVKTMLSPGEWPSGHHLNIVSVNNFPTAAGLASSAAGYAALMYALCQLFGIDDAARISTLARLGSGSACRSLYGGFVQWVAGADHATSTARQLLGEAGWPSMRVLVLVVSDHRKDTSSTAGMALTVQTSPLMAHRAAAVVPGRVREMAAAIASRDFDAFARLTMADSNQFHAVCADTYPPIRYMNDVSWSVVSLVHRLNSSSNSSGSKGGAALVAYTFDAGPNACLYLLEEAVPTVLAALNAAYAPKKEKGETQLEVKGIQYQQKVKLNKEMADHAAAVVRPGALKYVISTKLGPGPQVLTRTLGDEVSLMAANGLPKL